MTDMLDSLRAAEIGRAIAHAEWLAQRGAHESAKYWRDYAALVESWRKQASCEHPQWSEPVRANNRFGQRSTSLYETACIACGKREVRNGKARLIREVITALPRAVIL